MDMDLDITIDPDLLQIRLRSAHRYSNPIQIYFKTIQIRSDWIWIMWILDHIQSIAIPICVYHKSTIVKKGIGVLY